MRCGLHASNLRHLSVALCNYACSMGATKRGCALYLSLLTLKGRRTHTQFLHAHTHTNIHLSLTHIFLSHTHKHVCAQCASHAQEDNLTRKKGVILHVCPHTLVAPLEAPTCTIYVLCNGMYVQL